MLIPIRLRALSGGLGTDLKQFELVRCPSKFLRMCLSQIARVQNVVHLYPVLYE
jgi:hypothetical protein